MRLNTCCCGWLDLKSGSISLTCVALFLSLCGLVYCLLSPALPLVHTIIFSLYAAVFIFGLFCLVKVSHFLVKIYVFMFGIILPLSFAQYVLFMVFASNEAASTQRLAGTFIVAYVGLFYLAVEVYFFLVLRSFAKVLKESPAQLEVEEVMTENKV
jgi:hypothetical protein